jgi:hypothetical protein
VHDLTAARPTRLSLARETVRELDPRAAASIRGGNKTFDGCAWSNGIFTGCLSLGLPTLCDSCPPLPTGETQQNTCVCI